MADLTPEQGAKASTDIILKDGHEQTGHMPKFVSRVGRSPRGEVGRV